MEQVVDMQGLHVGPLLKMDLHLDLTLAECCSGKQKRRLGDIYLLVFVYFWQIVGHAFDVLCSQRYVVVE